MGSTGSESAQGSLGLFSPQELLKLLGGKAFTGRLVLVSSSSPRRVVAVHLDRGVPALVVGSGVNQPGSESEEAYRARQLLLEALGWSVGTFRVEPLGEALPPKAKSQSLGSVTELIGAARERARVWPRLNHLLPASFDEVKVTRIAGADENGAEPEEQIVLDALDRALPLASLGPRCGLDEHVIVEALVALANRGAVKLGSGGDGSPEVDPRVVPLARALLEAFEPDTGAHTLKLTVLSWDSRTCFRTVEAILGRNRRPPADIETQPKFQILHEMEPVSNDIKLEVLAFRDDVFDPIFAAPLVQNCHIFLLVTDMDAGHAWGAEQPLVERVEQLRQIFSGALTAARITVGAGAVTDPGCDALIPEIGRFVSWADARSQAFLPSLLTELCHRLSIDVPAPA